jgi:Wiskott-Aldrich syndrome protein
MSIQLCVSDARKLTDYRWQYSGVEGALVFVADKARGGLCFRVVDLSSGLGVVWDHELPKEIEYNQDKPFFHTWQADVSTFLLGGSR